MTGRPDNPYDEAPAAWALWQWVVQRIPETEVGEFAKVMADYRDEIRTEATSVATAATQAIAPTLTAEQLARLAMDGINTEGCDCGHPGMGVAWHRDWCAWRGEQR